MTALAVDGLWKRFRARRGDADAWALRDVSLRVPAGGAVGVIGGNGSGKSTLLQLVAGVLEATRGSVRTEGRVVAVLNPTAGFHPDLPGRANVRMLGALHGLGGRDIDGRMDAIVAFSGLEAFIDRPLRTYSAGMTLRLGFSTAAHLSPDLLVVDEVLSAGDLGFQRRALGLARQLRQQGTALLASTHSLGDLATLCDRLLLLDRGVVAAEGGADEVVAAYMQRLDRDGGRIEAGGAEVAGQRPMAPSGDVVLTSVIVNGVPDPAQIVVPTGGPLRIELRYRATREVDDAVFRVQLFRNDGLFVHGQNTARAGLPLRIEAGEGVLTLHYEHFGLLGGDYYLSVGVWPDEYRSFMTGEPYDHRPSAAIVRMVDKREDGAGVASFGGRWAHHAGVRT